MEEDNKILQEFKNGQNNALDFIFAKYKSMVISLSRRFFLLGADQEDLIQEGMLGLYKACLNFQPNTDSSFKSFAYLCIIRQMQSAVKSANRQKNFALNNALSLDSKNGIIFVTDNDANDDQKILYLPTSQDSPENEIIDQEEYNELIEKIKNSLSDFEFKVLEYYLDGFKCGQIASLTSSSYKTIDNALYRIKIKLQFLNNKK